MNGRYGVLPHIFNIGDVTWLPLSKALAEIEKLRGQSGLYSIYLSSDFMMGQERATQDERQQYQYGFALMVYGVSVGLEARGESLPHVPDEVETVSKYEYLSQVRRSLFETADLKAKLCDQELELVTAIANSTPLSADQNTGAPHDQLMFWHGATVAYYVLSQAAAGWDIQ